MHRATPGPTTAGVHCHEHRPRTVDGVQIDVLVVPDCPNQADAETRVHTALAVVGITSASVHTRLVLDLAQAEALGMQGSPTILIDGRDPFVVDGSPASISCRLFRSATEVSGCPTVDELVEAISARTS